MIGGATHVSEFALTPCIQEYDYPQYSMNSPSSTEQLSQSDMLETFSSHESAFLK